MPDNRDFLRAMLKHAGYTTTLTTEKLDALTLKFRSKLKMNVTLDLLAEQVNKLMKDNEFNQYMNELHTAEYGPQAPRPSSFRPVPQFSSSSNNKAEQEHELEYKYRRTFALPSPRPNNM